MTNTISKDEYLKRYLEPKKGKKRKFEDVTVKYISGDLPETLDAFYNDHSEAFPFPADHEEAPTVVRKATLSKAEKADKSKELVDKKKEAEIQARYDVWNRGIKTLEETYAKLKEQQYESSKPLARYADDADLTEHLKSKLHADDPMAEYFAKKKQKKKKHEKPKKKKGHKKHLKPEEDTSSSSSSESEEESQRPRYKGPEPPPNRYGIQPGYRWDGVDRSNGFERKIVEDMTRRRVEREIAQRWSVEDM